MHGSKCIRLGGPGRLEASRRHGVPLLFTCNTYYVLCTMNGHRTPPTQSGGTFYPACSKRGLCVLLGTIRPVGERVRAFCKIFSGEPRPKCQYSNWWSGGIALCVTTVAVLPLSRPALVFRQLGSSWRARCEGHLGGPRNYAVLAQSPICEKSPENPGTLPFIYA